MHFRSLALLPHCKRLKYSATADSITTKVHCAYPNIERTSCEPISFRGDTLNGVVRIDRTKPARQHFSFTITGSRIAPGCPQTPAAVSH